MGQTLGMPVSSKRSVGGAAALAAVCMCLATVRPAAAAEQFDPTFYADPSTWGGICSTGGMQSPINLPARYEELPAVPLDMVTMMRMPLVKEPRIVNEGHAIQVSLARHRVQIPAQLVKLDYSLRIQVE